MIEDRDGKTWFGYFFKGDNTVYFAMKSGKEERVFPYPNMSIQEARRRVKKKHLYTNLDGVDYKGFMHEMIEDCRKLAEDKWNKDTGRTRVVQVKIGGRE